MPIGPILEAAGEAQKFLERHDAKFCFIGGVAVQRWGEPRFTRDADLSKLAGRLADGPHPAEAARLREEIEKGFYGASSHA
jgi:hypothetical protein